MAENLRERKKRETQLALRLAALRLVDAHGLERVTVEMIAAAADVSARTFFNHFPSKEAALIGSGADAVAEVERFWAARPESESPLATLRALVLDRSAVFAEHTEELDLRMQVLEANPTLYSRFHAGFHEIERVLRTEVARRCGLDPERDLYPRLLAAVGGAAIRTSMDQWRAGDPRELSVIVEEAFDLCAVGLEPAPAPRRAPSRRRRSPSRLLSDPQASAPSPDHNPGDPVPVTTPTALDGAR